MDGRGERRAHHPEETRQMMFNFGSANKWSGEEKNFHPFSFPSCPQHNPDGDPSWMSSPVKKDGKNKEHMNDLFIWTFSPIICLFIFFLDDSSNGPFFSEHHPLHDPALGFHFTFGCFFNKFFVCFRLDILIRILLIPLETVGAVGSSPTTDDHHQRNQQVCPVWALECQSVSFWMKTLKMVDDPEDVVCLDVCSPHPFSSRANFLCPK